MVYNKYPFRIVFSLLITLFLYTKAHSQYTINSEYGNLTECDTVTSGIYIVWWDNNWDRQAEAELLLSYMNNYRDVCLNDLAMQDPPNPTDGYYYNVYLHQSGDIFPDEWANGQGTDTNGYPYLTLPIGAHNDWINVGHETFHVFQYSGTSPGFEYSGDSQWYIEAAANWFSAIQNPNDDRAFLEAESLVRLPHVALWLSYDNFPDSYPQNWQRYVHQYALALFLYYLSEETDVPDNLITDGLYAGTTDLPQEYFFNQIGGSVFRNHFIDWAAHMTNSFDFLPENQITRFETEWDDYADPLDDNEFIAVYQNTGSNGWVRPENDKVTTGWSYNTYKINNESTESYTFELNSDMFGSEGSPSYFQGKIIVQNTEIGTSFHDLEMDSDQEGSIILNLTPEDTSVYFIVASMPEIFTDVEQVYSYEIKISKGILGLGDFNLNSTPKKIIGRYDLLGRMVSEKYDGIQIILYNDGSSKKIYTYD